MFYSVSPTHEGQVSNKQDMMPPVRYWVSKAMAQALRTPSNRIHPICTLPAWETL